MLDEKANIFKVRYLHGKHRRICGRHKREGECALPGEVSRYLLAQLLHSKGCGKSGEKSPEGILGFLLKRRES